jgi:hypothetical protein
MLPTHPEPQARSARRLVWRKRRGGRAPSPSAGSDSTVDNWLLATTANIASAKDRRSPAGYTLVSQAQLHAANEAAR